MWSISQLFRIGLGPSSSHCIGPMRAALHFIESLSDQGIDCIRVDLYGSLAYTCHGHGTDKAIVSGLSGFMPDEVDAEVAENLLKSAHEGLALELPHSKKRITFSINTDLELHLGKQIGQHSNGMRFQALAAGEVVQKSCYFSVGGGFVENEHHHPITLKKETKLSEVKHLPFVFSSYDELEQLCEQNNLSIAALMMENECVLHHCEAEQVAQIARKLIDAMLGSLAKGLETEGTLPGGLNVERRAASLYQTSLQAKPSDQIFDKLNSFAMAVNEENASGCRVVTAPTNGASGLIPAVMRYYQEKHPEQDRLVDFLLTAAAIGILYKKNASISGADVGCQGEVGVASSMAAGALTAVLGGNLTQIEIASEIAMEHHLGMTCDPVAGLVQIPCIERNAMGALKAVNAARMALIGEHHPKVSLDQVIDTMYQTGQHMHAMFKETSQGGLAVNVVEC